MAKSKKKSGNSNNKKVQIAHVLHYSNGVTVKVFGGEGKLTGGNFVKPKKLPAVISSPNATLTTQALIGKKELTIEDSGNGGFKVV